MKCHWLWGTATLCVALTTSACGGSENRVDDPAEAAPDASQAAWVSAEDYSPDRFADAADVHHRWYPLQPGDRLDYRGSSLEDGEFVTAPAWVHGIAGATAGITIPSSPRTGTPAYAQGFAPKPISWDDHGKVYKTGQETCVPADCYSDVVVIEEFEPSIEEAWQDKYYAPGIGVVRVGWRGENDESKEVLELVEFRRLSTDELAEVRSDALALEERAYRISKDVWGLTAPAQARTS